MADEAGEKTEEATQARRDEFRKRGQIAQTRELASAMILFFGFLLIYLTGRYFTQQFLALFNTFLGDGLLQSIAQNDLKKMTLLAGKAIAELFLPIGVTLSFVATLSIIVQVGFLQIEDALEPKLEKIDPLNGFKRIFSLKSLMEGLTALVKIIMVGLVSCFGFK